MDTINEFLKNQLPKDFGLTDNKTIELLKECMVELKDYGFDINSKQVIPQNELPTQPFGHVDKITRERIINNQKKQSMDQIVEKFKTQATLTKNSTLSLNTDDVSSNEYDKDENDDLNPSRSSDYDKESVLSDLTDSNHSSLANEDLNGKRISSYNKMINSNNNNHAIKSPQNKIKVPINNTQYQTDLYAIKLDSQLDSVENFNINGSPHKKNITKIIYHSKGDIEYIRNTHGIYNRKPADIKTKTKNNTDYI